MDFVTPVLEICLQCWDRTAKYRLLIKGLRKVLKDLRMERDKLVSLSKDVKERVEKDDWERHRKPIHEVTGWLKAVEDLSNEVDGILKKGEEVVQKTCLGGHCPTNCRSRYKLAKEAEEVKARVVEALNTGLRLKAEEVTCEPTANAPMMRSHEPPVGMDSIFDRVCKLVEDETVRSIGLFGVGGVGKTTLLKEIHDHFLKTNPKGVIWVVVSRHVTDDQVQKKIWDKLNFSVQDWDRTEKEERAVKIQNFLSGRKFMLFLDDLWGRVDLADIGIPCNQPNSKVIFTTRSEEVCICMGAAKRMRVDCLPPEEAIQLFRKKVGEETWNAHHQIPELAEIVVRECQFLPLALVTIGAAMVFKKELMDWENVVQVMRTRPAQFAGMQEKVLSRLEFSYDALPDETHKKCFLFCCIFPDDSIMDQDDLIQLWIGEGYFDQYDSIHTARYHAKNVLHKLTSSCLLEETFNVLTEPAYKMHDLVLEMALWVSSEHGKATGKILVVKENQDTIGLNQFERWKDAEMISMVSDDEIQFIPEFPMTLPCLNLSTLLLRNTDIQGFPCGFFSSMPSLKVLDLSRNLFLSELPGDIEHLTNLQYLNLVMTSVTKLPEEFKNLVNLRFLFLNKNMNDDDFPEDVLSKIIPSLRVFSNLDLLSDSRSTGCYELLESLQRMEVDKSEVSLSLCFASEVKQLSSSPLLCCLRDLLLKFTAEVASIGFSKHVLRRMDHLVSLSFDGCASLAEIRVGEESSADISTKELREEVVVEEQELHFAATSCFKLASQDCFRHLLKVHVTDCGELLHLTSLIFYTPNLEELQCYGCLRLREIVRGDIPENLSTTIFSRLTVLILGVLPNLESICRRPLPFSSLKVLDVRHCENLQKLPFCVDNNNKLQRLQRIEGKEEWWNKLKWDDNVATQQLLTPKFQPIK